MSDEERSTGKDEIVYELWSDDELGWIEIPCPTLELTAFLEAWCEKNKTIFRRRPFGTVKPWKGRTLEHPVHGRVDVSEPW